jgi:cell division septal protein FtsQ
MKDSKGIRKQRRRRKVRSNATPRLWRGLWAWLRDGRLLGALISLASSLTLGYLFLAPDFQVNEIDVVGNLVLPEEEAVRQSRMVGMNLFLLDVTAIESVLEEVPYVEKVRVERSLPAQVRLRIWERFPSVSWWPISSPQRFLVDDTGLVLSPEQPGMYDLIYVVDMGEDRNPVEVGGQVDPEAVRTAQQVFSRLYNDLGIALYPFEYQEWCGVVAVAAEGWRACFGDSSYLEYKVRNLVALLQSGIAFSEVDLRLPEQIRYR